MKKIYILISLIVLFSGCSIVRGVTTIAATVANTALQVAKVVPILPL